MGLELTQLALQLRNALCLFGYLIFRLVGLKRFQLQEIAVAAAVAAAATTTAPRRARIS